jgi:hypothetical protein
MAQKKRDPDIMIGLPRGIAAYAYVDKADTEGQYSDDKFKVTVICEPDTDVSKIEATILDAAKAKWSDLDVDDFNMPFKLHDPDAKNEAFQGKLTYTAKSKFMPEVVDAKRNVLPEGTPVYSGSLIRTAASLYLYEKTEKVREGKKTVDVLMRGASLQLATVQIIEKRGGLGKGAGKSVLDDEDGFDSQGASGSAALGDDNDGDF